MIPSFMGTIMSEKAAKKVSSMQALKMAFTDRQVLAMLILGIASGLPYVAVGGTLNAWLTTVEVKPVEIALLTWALLAYAFKFLWAAALQGNRTPINIGMGPRRTYMMVFLGLVVIGLLGLTFSEPPRNLVRIGFISIFIAVASASFDIVLAGWRIEVARDDNHLDILSVVEQLGYRTASFVGGFVALLVADKIGWKDTFLYGTIIMAATSIGVLLAANSPIATAQINEQRAELLPSVSSSQKRIATLSVLAGWAIGFWILGSFMFGALTDPENNNPRNFIRMQGPWVILTTVVWLGFVAAYLVSRDKGSSGTFEQTTSVSVLDILYKAILVPMIELVGRLKWATLLVLALVLSYRFTDLIWGGFAYPFYLGENYGALGHSLTEVGFASKLMGVIATMIGVALGGIAMLIFGRMPILFLGAVLAALTNLLFADLASGAKYTDSFLRLFMLDDLFGRFDLDIRMARLTTVIFAENLAVGLASAASIAYLSSVVSKSYAAVQYALLVSLVMLLGVLGRPTIGAIIEDEGFAKAFIICAWLGAVAVVLSLLEWIRTVKAQKAD